jgi:hypothetical protein
MRMTTAVRAAVTLTLALAFAPAAVAQDQPRYDAPPGYTRCLRVTAWNGFFKWMSVRHTTCRRARRFLRAYARAADRGPMPRHLRGFRCTIRYWRNEDGDIYASRHRCVRGAVVIRFYGMV